MKRIFLLIVFSGILFSHFSFSQSSDYFQKYSNGKDLYKMGKYTLAMESFKPLMQEAKGNNLVEYSSFYYALSALQAKQTKVAKDMFLQITRAYPTWENLEEVEYWLARVHFENKEYLPALQYINKIDKKPIKEDAIEMKKYHLKAIEDVNLLQQLLEKNPTDKDIAVILAEKIASQPLVKQNQSLLEFLINDFGLDKSKYVVNQDLLSIKKEIYNVAVLFPFMYNELSTGKNIKNNYVLDVYQGLKLAKKRLEEENIKINLYAYDTKKDSVSAKRILDLPELKNMDLLVGPLTQGTIKVTSNFSYRNKINMMNPVSTNSEIVGNNPFSFLFKPSLETQAKKAAEFAMKEFGLIKEALIIYGTDSKDSILAHTYKKEVESNAFKTKMLKVSNKDSKKILSYLTPATNDTAAVLPNTFGHIFVASDEDMIAANTISAVDIRRDEIPIIGREEWLSFKFVSFDQLERLKVLFVAPNFIDYTSPVASKFKEEYFENYRSLPSQYSYAGFASMLYFGRMLKKYGNYFQLNLQKDPFQNGEIFAGHHYLKSSDNQFVPIVRFENAELIIVNK